MVNYYKLFPLKLGMQQEATLTTSLQYHTGSCSQHNKTRKRNYNNKGLESKKLSLVFFFLPITWLYV